MKLFENKHNLSVTELMNLHSLYEAHCTAEHILDNYYISENNNVEKAIELGYEVRRQMDKYGYSEEEAIDIVMTNYREEEN